MAVWAVRTLKSRFWRRSEAADSLLLFLSAANQRPQLTFNPNAFDEQRPLGLRQNAVPCLALSGRDRRVWVLDRLRLVG